jgi:omega-6 fatty acid desaturase (delta-12 desaturase)
MASTSVPAPSAQEAPSWHPTVSKYQRSDLRRSVWQLANTFPPFFALWYGMYLSLDVSYWLTLALAIPAGGFFVRVFIIFHDCGHGSFFRSQRANDVLGVLTGIMSFTPYYQWRHDHAVHHATAGDLDRRGIGDVWTATVKEYLQFSPWKRCAYRLVRNPIFMFGVAPLFLFLVRYRIPRRRDAPRERHSVYAANVAIVGILLFMHVTIGLKAFALVHFPIVLMATSAGVWLFYVQHQFPEALWDRGDAWDFEAVALQGSSFYKLPKVLQWFTGNIGYHHIHHLRPRIPNYFLERCQEETPAFQAITPVTLLTSLRSLPLRLYHEDDRRLVGFRHLRTLRKK